MRRAREGEAGRRSGRRAPRSGAYLPTRRKARAATATEEWYETERLTGQITGGARSSRRRSGQHRRTKRRSFSIGDTMTLRRRRLRSSASDGGLSAATAVLLTTRRHQRMARFRRPRRSMKSGDQRSSRPARSGLPLLLRRITGLGRTSFRQWNRVVRVSLCVAAMRLLSERRGGGLRERVAG